MILRLYDERLLQPSPPWCLESAERLAAVVQRLQQTGLWGELTPLEFSPAPWEQLLWVHEDWYLEDLEQVSAGGGALPPPDLAVTAHTWELACLAAGACLAAAEAVTTGPDLAALCLVRPPGHLALPARARGFCLLNNCALAAEAALRSGAARVALVDLDCHHGEGLQEVFYARGDVLYLSIHQLDLFPGTGTVDELGLDAGLGLNVNVPLPPGARGEHYRRAWEELFAPLLRRYAPDVLIVAAGYDAHWRDPLTDMGLTADDFHALLTGCTQVAGECCSGRLLVALEGGYDPEALARCAQATVHALLGEPPAEPEAPPPPLHPTQQARVEEYLEHALAQHHLRLRL